MRSNLFKVMAESVHIFTAICIDLRISLIRQDAHACVPELMKVQQNMTE